MGRAAGSLMLSWSKGRKVGASAPDFRFLETKVKASEQAVDFISSPPHPSLFRNTWAEGNSQNTWY